MSEEDKQKATNETPMTKAAQITDETNTFKISGGKGFQFRVKPQTILRDWLICLIHSWINLMLVSPWWKINLRNSQKNTLLRIALKRLIIYFD